MATVLQTTYHKRQLNLDGTWKENPSVLLQKGFLEYISPKRNFVNPLDSKLNVRTNQDR
jgi:hypothetical protein